MKIKIKSGLVRLNTRMLTLDPGLNGTGYALWNEPATPYRIGVIHAQPLKGNPLKKMEWWDRAESIASQVMDLFPSTEDIKIVSEFTEYHAAATSNMGWRTGDLQRLTFLCGMISGYALAWQQRMGKRCEIIPVTTSGWKGQLPKDVAAKRVQELVGVKRCRLLGLPKIERRSDTHAWDAVGIGLWALGRF